MRSTNRHGLNRLSGLDIGCKSKCFIGRGILDLDLHEDGFGGFKYLASTLQDEDPTSPVKTIMK